MTFKEAFENWRKATNDFVGVMLNMAIDFENTTPMKQHKLIFTIQAIQTLGDNIMNNFKEDIK